MPDRLVTLSLPAELLKRAEEMAVEKNTSVSILLGDLLAKMVVDDQAYENAGKRIRQRMRAGLDLGTAGNTIWKRENLHER